MDIVVIVAGNSYATKRAVINLYDATLEFPGLEVGAKLTPVLASLMEAGFVVRDFEANGNVTTYFLVREVTPPVDNPLEALEGRLNTQVTIQTGAGTVSGTLVFIGSNVIEILEPSGDMILIPAISIQTVI